MALRIATALALPLLIAGAGALDATTPLQATMRTWNADAMTLRQMINGAGAFDKTEATQLLQRFAADSQAISAQTTGSGADDIDIKSRFEGFAADVQLTIDAIHAGDNVSPRFSKLRADCESCHDAYQN